MNILHIIDDHKFIKICSETFKINKLNNFFLKSGEITLDYITLNKIDCVVIHFLRVYEINFFYKNHIKVKKIWMSWGGDIFNLPLFYDDFLDLSSKKMNYIIHKKQGHKRLLTHFLKIVIKKLNINFSNKKISVINDFDYIVPIVPGDYDILVKKYNVTAPMYHFNYVTEILENKGKIGNNIIVGNSATLSNNHLTVIKKLREVIDNKTIVYLPLNYGNAFYRDFLLKNLKYDQKFTPLTEFIPLDKYNDIIKSCGIMIMNHQRQQALGNILMGLMNGCTIYLNGRSSLYRYLKSCDFNIFTFKQFDIKFRLNDTQILENIELTKKYFGKEMQTKKIRNLLKMIHEQK